MGPMCEEDDSLAMGQDIRKDYERWEPSATRLCLGRQLKSKQATLKSGPSIDCRSISQDGRKARRCRGLGSTSSRRPL